MPGRGGSARVDEAGETVSCRSGRRGLSGLGRPGNSGGVTTALPTSEESPELAARRAARLGGTDGVLPADAVTRFIADQLKATDLEGKSVCIIVPDATRTCPMPLLLKAVHGALHGRVAR